MDQTNDPLRLLNRRKPLFSMRLSPMVMSFGGEPQVPTASARLHERN